MGGAARELDRLMADAYQRGFHDARDVMIRTVCENTKDVGEASRCLGLSVSRIEEILSAPGPEPTRFHIDDWVRESNGSGSDRRMRISRVYNDMGVVIYFAQNVNDEGVKIGYEKMYYEEELVPEPDVPLSEQ